jgi:hypothetical protein
MTMLGSVLVGAWVATPVAAQQALSESMSHQQRHAAGLLHASNAIEPAQPAPGLAFGSADTYRWEGAIAGAVVGALMFGSLAANACDDGCGLQTAESAFLGGIFGGFSGMLIGNLFSKHPPVRDHGGGAAATP